MHDTSVDNNRGPRRPARPLGAHFLIQYVRIEFGKFTVGGVARTDDHGRESVHEAQA
jgi:hypothetical protein